METPAYAGCDRLDATAGGGMPSISSLSLSPDSSQATTTPETPRDTRNLFGTAVALTPTPHGSFEAQLASYAGFSLRQMATAAAASKDAAPADPGHQLHPSDVPYQAGSHVRGRTLPQLWTPRPTLPDRCSLLGRETPVHMRWGSLDTHQTRSALLAPVQSVPRFSSLVPEDRQNLAADGMALRSCADQMAMDVHHLARFSRLGLGPNAGLAPDHVPPGSRPVKPLEAASGAFGLSELRSALPNPARANYHEGRALQDLGIDVLRLSPKEYPIRPPAPSSANGQPSSGHSHGHGFLPMQAVVMMQRQQQQQQTARSAFAPCGAASHEPPSSTKFSARYHGMHSETNASAEHVPTDQNCALWLTNLPPGLTVRQLLAAIRNVGRIWCSYINYPDYIAHQTAAAKVVFFSPDAAQGLLSTSWTRGLYIQGHRVKVSHNRIKYGSHAAVGKMSRVLIVTGRADFVNENSLTKFFKDRFIFQVDEVVELIKAGGRAVVEYKFGSYRCQSQMGKMSLEKDRPAGFEKVEFGDDPCEVGDTMSSYGIAAERIQGKGL